MTDREPLDRRPGYDAAKRSVDVLLALAALVATLPLWIVAAATIRVASPGPVFFVQERVGRTRRPFRMVKFRTMHVRPAGGQDSSVTVVGDARVFRGGAWLRRTKLDELPQLLNVLAGTMSLVGPRPTVASDYDRMSERQRRRADVLPGMTGLAQLRGGAVVPWPARLSWDLEYVAKRSLALDLRLLAETAWMLAAGRVPGESLSPDEWTETMVAAET